MFNDLMRYEAVEKLVAKDFFRYMSDVGYKYNTKSLRIDYKKLWGKRKDEKHPTFCISAVKDGFLEDFLLLSKKRQELLSLTTKIQAEVEEEVKIAKQNLKKAKLKQTMIRHSIQSGTFDDISLDELL